MPRPEELYLADIVDACRDVVQFLHGLNLDDWQTAASSSSPSFNG